MINFYIVRCFVLFVFFVSFGFPATFGFSTENDFSNDLPNYLSESLSENLPENLSDNLSDYRGQTLLSNLFFSGQRRLVPFFRYEFRHKPFTFDTSLPKSPQRFRTWIRGFGNWSQLGHSDGTADLEYYAYGVSVGIDRQIGRNFLFGVSLGGIQNSSQGGDGLFHWKSDLSAVHTSAYFRIAFRNFFFDLEGGFGYNDQSFPSRTAIQWNCNSETGIWWAQ
ncbi:MAG: autotransporter outer membrane beta-barrel domain-containing protein, partial [Planctomycetaceae bacterium]|nr:autotransporter outer membrane beta-barrel domain-containing protein [Planctomycetaceae bacterium]